MDLDYGSKVYWDPRSTVTSHVFIVGPSGSGKSVALSTLSYRIAEKFRSMLTVFDVKAEHYHLLRFSGLEVHEFNPLKMPLPLCFCDDSRVDSEQNINAFLKVFQKVYGISSSLYRTLYENIKYICYRCEPVERLYDVVENLDALNDIVKVFEVYPSKGSDPVEGVLRAHSVFSLKEVFLSSTALSSFIIYYTIDRILRNASLSFSNTPQRVVVLDELWHVAPHIIDELIQILTRYSRGYGVAFFMATQSIDDVGMYADAISSSSALLLAMASPTHSYWSRISRYLNLSRKGIDRAVKLSGQGECVVRMYPFEAPMFIYMDPLES